MSLVEGEGEIVDRAHPAYSKEGNDELLPPRKFQSGEAEETREWTNDEDRQRGEEDRPNIEMREEACMGDHAAEQHQHQHHQQAFGFFSKCVQTMMVAVIAAGMTKAKRRDEHGEKAVPVRQLGEAICKERCTQGNEAVTCPGQLGGVGQVESKKAQPHPDDIAHAKTGKNLPDHVNDKPMFKLLFQRRGRPVQSPG